MADGLTINRASFRQQEKLATRNCRRSGQFSSREDREVIHEITLQCLALARKPVAIAQEFGDAKIQHSNRCEISGLPHDRGVETGAGCSLAAIANQAMNDFSDGWRASLTKTRFKAPSTRRQQTDSRAFEFSTGQGFAKFVEVLDRLH